MLTALKIAPLLLLAMPLIESPNLPPGGSPPTTEPASGASGTSGSGSSTSETSPPSSGGTGFPAPQLSPKEVEVYAKRTALDPDVQRQRLSFGLRSDTASIEDAVRATLKRTQAGDNSNPLGTPLTEAELVAADQLHDWNVQLQAVQEVMSLYPDSTAGISFNGDVDDPAFQVQLTPKADENVRQAIAHYVPKSLPWSFTTVNFSASDLNGFYMWLDQAMKVTDDAAAGTESQFRAILSGAGLIPEFFRYDLSWQTVTLFVHEKDNSIPSQENVASTQYRLDNFTKNGRMPRVVLQAAPPRSLASGPTDSPGTAKAGLRIFQGAAPPPAMRCRAVECM